MAHGRCPPSFRSCVEHSRPNIPMKTTVFDCNLYTNHDLSSSRLVLYYFLFIFASLFGTCALKSTRQPKAKKGVSTILITKVWKTYSTRIEQQTPILVIWSDCIVSAILRHISRYGVSSSFVQGIFQSPVIDELISPYLSCILTSKSRCLWGWPAKIIMENFINGKFRGFGPLATAKS